MLSRSVVVKTDGKLSPSVLNEMCLIVREEAELDSYTVFTKTVKFKLTLPISEEHIRSIEDKLEGIMLVYNTDQVAIRKQKSKKLRNVGVLDKSKG